MQDLLWLKPQVLKTPPAVQGGDSRTSWPAAPPHQAISLLVPCHFSLQINFTFYIQCVYIIGELYRFCLLNVPSLCTSHPPSRPVPATQSLPSPHWWFSPLQVCVCNDFSAWGPMQRAAGRGPETKTQVSLINTTSGSRAGIHITTSNAPWIRPGGAMPATTMSTITPSSFL